tara:strand:- start:146 stop:2443 length:2298 start_codon:yes stop_codon:yes gene_type:complete
MPAPNPYFLANHAAEKIHHRNFRLRSQKTPDFGQKIAGPELIKETIRRMWRDFLSLPQILKHGLGLRLRKDIDHVAQDIVGKNSWLQVIQKTENSGGTSVTEEQIEETINSINTLLDRPENAVVFGDEWSQVLQYTLGVVDGSEEARGIRESAGDERWVTVELQALAPETHADLASVAQEMGASDSRNERPSQKEGTSNLLSLVTERFFDQTNNAKRRFREIIHKIERLQRPEDQTNDVAAKIIKVLFASSFFILLLSVFVFSPFHEAFGNEVDQVWRFRLFILITVPVLLPVLSLFAPRDEQSRQVYNVVTFVLTIAISAFGLFFPKITAEPWFTWVGVVLMAILAVVIILKVTGALDNEIEDDEPKSSIALRLCYVLFPIYILIVLIFGLNNDYYQRELGIDGGYFGDNPGWFIVTVILSIALFISSGAYVSKERYREDHAFNDWESQFRWLTEEAKSSARDLRLVESYQTQWLGTALVLARLFRYPHGVPTDRGMLGEQEASPPSNSQKLQVISLIPTETGIDAFRQNANLKINEPGWLTTQYHSMVREFQKNRIHQTQGMDQVTAVLPETDPYPVTLEDALAGNASGQRWPFCYNVYSGRYDKALRETAVSKLTQALLETYLDHPNSYETSTGAATKDDLSKAFSDLIATEQQIWVPAVFGTEVAVNFQGSQMFTSNVWWPQDLLAQPESELNEWNSIHTAHTSSSATSIFTQVIRVDISSPIVLSSLMSGRLPESDVNVADFDAAKTSDDPNPDPFSDVG